MTAPSVLKRRAVVDALRVGAVPQRGLELIAVGLDHFTRTVDEELASAAAGTGVFKAIRGDYGTGKTFFARWFEHRAREQDFATTLVQVSETDTPLYRMETIYRRAIEALQTKEWSDGAFRSLIDRWLYNIESDVLTRPEFKSAKPEAVSFAVGELLEQRLATVSATQPQFAAVLRACHKARVAGEHAISEGLIAWLMGQPNVGADIKRQANIKGDLDHFGAAGFFRGLLEILRQTGRRGLVLVLDEVETIQRVRSDSREKSLNALRQLIDDLVAGRYPGLYVVITGTPQFFTGPQGVQRLPPLAQRLEVDLSGDPAFDNPRAPQVRLQPFTFERMVEVGLKLQALYPSEVRERIDRLVDRQVMEELARGVTGKLGGKVGIAPRLYLKRLVDVLDRVDQHSDFDPRKHYEVIIKANEMTAEERVGAGIERSVDDIELELQGTDKTH